MGTFRELINEGKIDNKELTKLAKLIVNFAKKREEESISKADAEKILNRLESQLDEPVFKVIKYTTTGDGASAVKSRLKETLQRLERSQGTEPRTAISAAIVTLDK